MTAARGHRLSLAVHAVDDSGALCGARPHHGRWLPTERVPITCPACLRRLSQARYSLCETPTASSMSPLHVRRVGPEGIKLGGNAAQAKTLCGQVVGWDIEEVRDLGTDLGRHRRVCPTCRRIASAPHLASQR